MAKGNMALRMEPEGLCVLMGLYSSHRKLPALS